MQVVPAQQGGSSAPHFSQATPHTVGGGVGLKVGDTDGTGVGDVVGGVGGPVGTAVGAAVGGVGAGVGVAVGLPVGEYVCPASPYLTIRTSWQLLKCSKV